MRNYQELFPTFMLRADKVSQKTGKAPLTCRLTISGKYADVSTKIKIPYNQWDQEEKKLLPTAPATLAADITNFLIDINTHFNALKLEYDEVTPIMLRNKYEGKNVYHVKNNDLAITDQTLLRTADALINDFEIEVNKGKRSKETLKQWKATRAKLIEYLTFKKTGKLQPNSKKIYMTPEEREQYINEGKKHDILIHNIKPVFANDFRTYLTVTRDGVLEEIAADKQLKNTKQILKYAVDKAWLLVNPLSGFKCTAKEKDVIPLDFWQIEKIENKTGLSKRLEIIRDCFIFIIYTGFAFQDIKALSHEHIFCEPITGQLYLSKKRGKTDVDEMVPILPPIFALIEKYKDDPYCLSKNVLMPVPSNSCFNEYLKELALLCGIQKNLNTHLGRHTFAFLMLSFGVPLEILSQMMGHKSIRTTQRYCRVSILLIIEKVQPITEKMFDQLGKLNFFQKFNLPAYARLKSSLAAKFEILTPEAQALQTQITKLKQMYGEISTQETELQPA